MRIAHVSATFPPYPGGTGYVCQYQAQQLVRQGHEVRVFTSAVPGAPNTETRDGVIIQRLRRLAGSGNAPVLPSLVTALRGFDIVHLHAPFASGAEFAAIACRANAVPLVVTYHNDLVRSGSPRDIAFALATHSLRWVLTARVEKVIFVSQGHAETCDMRSLHDTQPEKCKVILNGIDLHRFARSDDRDATRERLGIARGARLVGFVGGLDPAHHYKGLDVLLGALRHEQLELVELLIVGDGALRSMFEAQARELGVDSKVHFVGAVDHHELPALYRACDAVAVPSIAPEAFSLVIVEALACGVPVVASRFPGTLSIVEHGSTGLLVEPGDAEVLARALDDVLSNDDLRARLATRGHQMVTARHSWERIGQELEAVYLTVLRHRENSRSHSRYQEKRREANR